MILRLSSPRVSAQLRILFAVGHLPNMVRPLSCGLSIYRVQGLGAVQDSVGILVIL